MSSPITVEALVEVARRHRRAGVTDEVAIVLAYAELEGQPLDAERFDDAAIVLRAERLLLDEVPIADALTTARAELVTFSTGACG